MIYLIFAIISSATLAVVLKYFRHQEGNRYGLIIGNYLACIILSFILMPSKTLITHPESVTLVCSFAAGISFVLGLVFFQASIKTNGAALSAAFAKLGIVVSLTVSILIFGERPATLQLLGIGIVLLAIILINSDSADAHTLDQAGAGGQVSILLLFATLAFGGASDTMAKVFERVGRREEDTVYLFFLFVVAIILSSLLGYREYRHSGKKIVRKEFCAGILAGIPNYFSSLLILKALSTLPAFLTYSVFSTCTILLVTIISAIFFHEKLGKKSIAAMGLILLSLVLLQ